MYSSTSDIRKVYIPTTISVVLIRKDIYEVLYLGCGEKRPFASNTRKIYIPTAISVVLIRKDIYGVFYFGVKVSRL